MDTMKEGWKGFIQICLSTDDPKILSALFELFLTAEEKNSLAMRFLIIKELLLERHTQREIAQKLNVSIAKITRGSNELKRVKSELIEFIKQKL